MRNLTLAFLLTAAPVCAYATEPGIGSGFAAVFKRFEDNPELVALDKISRKDVAPKYWNHGMLPPVEYDGTYQGHVTITTVNNELMAMRCPKTPFNITLGCVPYTNEKECEIVLASNEVIKAAGFTRAIVIRHELGHCGNRWGKDHKGARPLPP